MFVAFCYNPDTMYQNSFSSVSFCFHKPGCLFVSQDLATLPAMAKGKFTAPKAPLQPWPTLYRQGSNVSLQLQLRTGGGPQASVDPPQPDIPEATTPQGKHGRKRHPELRWDPAERFRSGAPCWATSVCPQVWGQTNTPERTPAAETGWLSGEESSHLLRQTRS